MKTKDGANRAGWFSRYGLTIVLVITIVGIVSAFEPAAYMAKDLFIEAGRQRGRSEILNLPRANEAVTKSLDDFREVFSSGKKWSEDGLRDSFAAQWWVSKRVSMAEKLMSEQMQSAGSPGEIDMIGHQKIWEMIRQLHREADAFSSAIQARHTKEEVDQARVKFEQEYYYLQPHDSVSYVPLVFSILGGYLKSALWMGIYFSLKTKRHGHSLLFEIGSGRLFLAMVAFPIMFGIYPWGDPKMQIRMFLRNIASLASLVMCWTGPAGVTFAKSSFGKKRSTHPIVLVCKVDGSPGYLDKPPERMDLPAEISVGSPKDAPPTAISKRLTWNASTILLPRYIGIAGGRFSRWPVLQTNVSATLPNGFTFGIWISKSMTSLGTLPNFGNEIDLSVDYGKQWHGVSLDVGMSQAITSPISGLPQGNVIQVRASASKSFTLTKGQTIAPHILVRNFHPIIGATPGKGTFYQVGVDHSFKFNRRGEINSTGEIVSDTGTFGFVLQKVIRWNTDFSWSTGAGKLKIQLPAIRFTDPLGYDPVRVRELMFGIGASW